MIVSLLVLLAGILLGKESIAKIIHYDDDIILYPGHYEITNLGEEKKNNPFFK